jgi:hypothetical protein
MFIAPSAHAAEETTKCNPGDGEQSPVAACSDIRWFTIHSFCVLCAFQVSDPLVVRSRGPTRFSTQAKGPGGWSRRRQPELAAAARNLGPRGIGPPDR